jgi:hypothetical protein
MKIIITKIQVNRRVGKLEGSTEKEQHEGLCGRVPCAFFMTSVQTPTILKPAMPETLKTSQGFSYSYEKTLTDKDHF